MKHLKNFEGFFDLLKGPKNEIELQLELILERLTKARSQNICPYQIKKLNEYPDWIEFKDYGSHRFYEVVFDDITLVVDSAFYLSPSGGHSDYHLYFTETDSGERNVKPEESVRESLAKKFWKVLSDLKKIDDKNKSSSKLKGMINQEADLL